MSGLADELEVELRGMSRRISRTAGHRVRGVLQFAGSDGPSERDSRIGTIGPGLSHLRTRPSHLRPIAPSDRTS